MKIRMLTSESTRIDGVARRFYPGEEYELEDNLAKAWILLGLAEAVKQAKAKRTTEDE